MILKASFNLRQITLVPILEVIEYNLTPLYTAVDTPPILAVYLHFERIITLVIFGLNVGSVLSILG